MNRRTLRLAALPLMLLLVAACSGPATTPSPTKTPTVTPSPTATPSPTVTPSVTASPAVTASPEASASTVANGSCDPADLAARITMWEGAAGSRIASVDLTNEGTVACLVPSVARPQLLDGQGLVLIEGEVARPAVGLLVAPGATLQTLVQDSNYCGAAPTAPVTIAFQFLDGDSLMATPLSANDATVPPCNGAGEPAHIEMQPWAAM